jgi:alpha-tubulin suppressor-like RCC1 family protein
LLFYWVFPSHCFLIVALALCLEPCLSRAGQIVPDPSNSFARKVNLSVSFRFPEKGHEEQIELWRYAFQHASELMWDATDGQLQIGTITWSANERLNSADIWVFDCSDPEHESCRANGGGAPAFTMPGAHVTHYMDDVDWRSNGTRGRWSLTESDILDVDGFVQRLQDRNDALASFIHFNLLNPEQLKIDTYDSSISDSKAIITAIVNRLNGLLPSEWYGILSSKGSDPIGGMTGRFQDLDLSEETVKRISELATPPTDETELYYLNLRLNRLLLEDAFPELIAVSPKAVGDTILHELGHYLFGLVDEYRGPLFVDGELFVGSLDEETGKLQRASAASRKNGNRPLVWERPVVKDGKLQFEDGVVVTEEIDAECHLGPEHEGCLMGEYSNWRTSEFCSEEDHDKGPPVGEENDADGVAGHANNTGHEAVYGKSCWERMVEDIPYLSWMRVPVRGPILAPPSIPADKIEWEKLNTQRRYVICLDRSGSMKIQNRMRNAKRGAFLFYDLIEEGDLVGVTSYATDTTVNLTLREKWDSSDDVSAFKLSAESAIQAKGATSIGDGLRASLSTILANRDDRGDEFDDGGRPLESIILLLSDGQQNNGESPSRVIRDLKRAGIRVYAFGLGLGADERLLGHIAGETGGKYSFIRTSGDLVKSFALLQGILGDGEEIFREVIRLMGGAPDTRILKLEANQREARLVYSWGDGDVVVGFKVTSPDGKVYEESSREDRVFIIGEDSSRVIRMEEPIPGDWTVEMIANDLGAGETLDVELRSYAFNPGLQVSAQAHTTEIEYPEPIRLSASAVFPAPVTGMPVRATVIRPDDSQVEIDLFDDGSHDDGLPEDGVYGAVFRDFSDKPVGSYTFRVEFDNTGASAFPARGEGVESGSRKFAELSAFFRCVEFSVSLNPPSVWKDVSRSVVAQREALPGGVDGGGVGQPEVPGGWGFATDGARLGEEGDVAFVVEDSQDRYRLYWIDKDGNRFNVSNPKSELGFGISPSDRHSSVFSFALGNNGELVFHAIQEFVGSGLYRWHRDTGITEIVTAFPLRTWGTPTEAPGTGGLGFKSLLVNQNLFESVEGGSFSLRDDGTVVFSASVEGGRIGIWEASPSGEMTLVFMEGEPFLNDREGSISNLEKVLSSEVGSYAVISSLEGLDPLDPDAKKAVWYESAAGERTIIVYEGDDPLGDGSSLRDFSGLSFNSRESIVFFARDESDSDINPGLWLKTKEGELRLIAEGGMEAPGGLDGPILFDTVQTSSRSSVVNDHDEIVFVTGERVWLRNREGELKIVAQINTLAPGTDFLPFGYARSFNSRHGNFGATYPVINNRGQVAFVGKLWWNLTDEFEDYGIWASDEVGQLRLLARGGDSFNIAQGEGRIVNIIPDDLVFSDEGQLLFRLRFTDSSSDGMFVADLSDAFRTEFVEVVGQPQVGGHVKVFPLPVSSGKYEVGTTMRFVPESTEGYVFAGWSGDATGSQIPFELPELLRDVEVNAHFRPDNDMLSESKALVGNSVAVSRSNLGASKEEGESEHVGGLGAASVWWNWTAGSSGGVTISTEGSDFDTVLGVYTGIDLSALTQVATDDNGGSELTSVISFDAEAGQTYQIVVDGAAVEDAGLILLSIKQQANVFPVAVSAGKNHSTMILNDGTLWAWGRLLGENPVQIGAATGWSAVDAGDGVSLALKEDGSLWQFYSFSAELSPVMEGVLWKAISVGGEHFLGVQSDGSLWAWGENSSGQLGDGSMEFRESSVRIGEDSDWIHVSAGLSHTSKFGRDLWAHSLAIKEDGTLWGWGHSDFKQLGDDNRTFSRSVPAQIGSDTDWIDARAGRHHSVGLKADLGLWTWGEEFQDGSGFLQLQGAPTLLRSDPPLYQRIDVGGNHTVAIKEDGRLWVFGDNSDGQLGVGEALQGATWGRVPIQAGGEFMWKQVAAGGGHTLAVRSDNSLWAWGANSLGQLGNGSLDSSDVPVPIASSTFVSSISQEESFLFTLSKTGDGEVIAQPNGNEFIAGTELGLTAVPNAGWEFVEWTGDVGSSENPVTLTMSSDKSVSAVFRAIELVPSLSLQPLGQTVEPGASVTLTAIGSGTGPLLYQWRFNGELIPGATQSNYTIASVQLVDAGSYDVVVSNAVGSMFSDSAVITVIPPGIVEGIAVRQLPDTYTLGSVFQVSLGVKPLPGTGSYAVQDQPPSGWVVSNINEEGSFDALNRLVKWGPFFDGAARTLTYDVMPVVVEIDMALFSGIAAFDGVDYIVEGAVEASLLVIETAPVITVQPSGLTVDVGDPVILKVEATGSGELSYQWHFNGVAIPGGTGATYVMFNVQSERAGVYMVEVRNGVGVLFSEAAFLTVAEPIEEIPPVITVQPSGQSVDVGDPVVLKVEASGSGELSYQWHFNGVVIPGGTGATYVMFNVQSERAGVYMVEVRNGVGALFSEAAILTVAEPIEETAPVITVQPTGLRVDVGDPVILKVEATGSGELSYQWHFNGVAIPGGTGATYVMFNVQSEKAGVYSVGVSNEAGTTSSDPAELVINEPVTIAIRWDGSQWVIDWSGGGILQAAENVRGPWADVVGSTSPVSVNIKLSQRFYRVVR